VYRLPITAAGGPGTRQLVVAFSRSDEPAGVAVLPDGGLAVTLRAVSAVAVLDKAGAVRATVTGAALGAPTSLALLGDVLLVTNQAPSTPGHWAVLAVGWPPI
jgi:hypothetical protein